MSKTHKEEDSGTHQNEANKQNKTEETKRKKKNFDNVNAHLFVLLYILLCIVI